MSEPEPSFTPPKGQELDNLLSMITKLLGRVEHLEALSVVREAETQAALHCLRDFVSIADAALKKRYQRYFAEAYQILLNQIEDADPWKAALLDLRPVLPEEDEGTADRL